MNGPHHFFEAAVIIGAMSAPSGNRHLIIHGPEDVQYDMPDSGEALRGMISPHSGRVFTESDVRTPMERALRPNGSLLIQRFLSHRHLYQCRGWILFHDNQVIIYSHFRFHDKCPQWNTKHGFELWSKAEQAARYLSVFPAFLR